MQEVGCPARRRTATCLTLCATSELFSIRRATSCSAASLAALWACTWSVAAASCCRWPISALLALSRSASHVSCRSCWCQKEERTPSMVGTQLQTEFHARHGTSPFGLSSSGPSRVPHTGANNPPLGADQAPAVLPLFPHVASPAAAPAYVPPAARCASCALRPGQPPAQIAAAWLPAAVGDRSAAAVPPASSGARSPTRWPAEGRDGGVRLPGHRYATGPGDHHAQSQASSAGRQPSDLSMPAAPSGCVPGQSCWRPAPRPVRFARQLGELGAGPGSHAAPVVECRGRESRRWRDQAWGARNTRSVVGSRDQTSRPDAGLPTCVLRRRRRHQKKLDTLAISPETSTLAQTARTLRLGVQCILPPRQSQFARNTPAALV